MMSKNDQSRTQRQNPRYSDVTDEPIMRRLSPIEGYKVVSLVSLENAIAPVSKFFNGIENYVSEAKENCKSPADGLNQDESASIYLYTMQFDAGPSLYTILNATLRRENRDSLKPWFFFLKLFLTALSKLPSCAKTVWRGVRDVDLGFKYPTEKKFVWWGISSCTLSIDILESNSFFGTQGVRTLFSIECTDGKLIGSHSYYKNREQEVILMPGSHFEVRGQLNPTGGLHIIQLKQTDSPIVLRNSYPIKKFPISKPTPTPSSGRKLGLIILGNSGVGKSFLANILLDEEAFVHKASPQAVTTETEFKEINMGNETYAIFNIPGLIEADQKRIDTNIVEIHKAFSERPTSLILYVFGSQSGRIRDEDVVAFNALNKAYSFKLESLVLIFNGLPKDRPKNYEGEAIVLLKELIKVPCRTLCFLDAINKNDRYERQKLKNKLLQVIVERTAHLHQKKQDIELERDEVYKAKAQIKHLQAAFRENKQMYEEKIKEQQKVYDDMFIKIRNENEHIRRLVERQAEEARELKKQMDEQQAANKREQEQRDAKHQEKILKMQQKHERAIREANERAAQQITQEERRAKKISAKYLR